MATAQALSLNQDPSKSICAVYPTSSLASGRCVMGSVGSLIEKPDVSPTKSNRAVPQVPGRQNHGLLKKGFNQRELLNYLNITKKEAKGSKHIISGTSSIKREHRREENDVYTKVYHRDGKELDLGKNSLPIGGKFDKVNKCEKVMLHSCHDRFTVIASFQRLCQTQNYKLETLTNGRCRECLGNLAENSY